ncbi:MULTISPECIES: ABC transporter permease [unclassified Francisella]|uniref:ABC transporter permease n=1 Tax=unclassified Francisella TaxID=2610885 RepID=UPI002E310CF6|nr:MULTISPECIES: ABC transporter permease [unclassified Francisella]MED7820384.1 ABC transporter permease [Francisella sp. 19S2-4]MED7831219.1 ABC transporter permease [Francisella sp. 19S2-10]
MTELYKNLIQHKNVIWALFNREITTKFGDSYFGYAWILIEPLLQVGIFFILFYWLQHSTGNMPIILFLLTGIVPYFFLQKSVTSCSNAISANQGLLTYRQVKVVDTIITRIILEYSTTLAVIILCGTLMVLYSPQPVTVYYPLRIVFSFFILFLLALGLSLLFAILNYYYLDLNKFLSVLFRFLYFTSGVFFSLNDLPQKFAYYLSYNPIFQAIEIIRSAFDIKNSPSSQYLSYNYTLLFSIIVLFLGILFYYVARDNILMNARSR